MDSITGTNDIIHSANIIPSMLRPDTYDHPADNIQLIETHISWLILAGDYAYKIKKPVNLGFLDFSSLQKRLFYCQEEIRLNKRLAPQLYIDVVRITGTQDKIAINGNSNLIDYAVKMKRFETDQQFDLMLMRGELTFEHMNEVAEMLANFHMHTTIADDQTDYGSVSAIANPIDENFTQLRPLIKDVNLTELLDKIQAWSHDSIKKHSTLLQQRKQQGHIRECHGDLHAANLAIIDGHVSAFDCLEFNPTFRWIDTISEIAFLAMDLDAHQRPDLARHFLNQYLERSGDYEGLPLLDLYRCYRAMVRAKVSAIQASQHSPDSTDSAEYKNLSEQVSMYIKLAADYTQSHAAALLITHGFSGSGKTYLTTPLLHGLNAFRVRSDVERKRLFNLAAEQQSNSAIDSGIYNTDASEKTYNQLHSLAKTITTAGYTAIIDATFLKQTQRSQFTEWAQQHNIPCLILDFQASDIVLRKRISQRLTERKDASEATLDVLNKQQDSAERFTESEQTLILNIDTEQETKPQQLQQAIIEKLISNQPHIRKERPAEV